MNLSTYALPMLVFGVLFLMQASQKLKGLGWILVGIGFLFLGIHYMKEGFAAYSEQIDLTQYAMTGIAGLLVFTLLGSVATVVMQSSHATLTLIITALAAGQISYENALALAIWAATDNDQPRIPRLGGTITDPGVDDRSRLTGFLAGHCR